MARKSIVLYSGGLDSTVVLAQAIHDGDDVLALSINYNQSNLNELNRCADLAACWGFPHRLIHVSLERTDAREEIPARNTVFLAKALEFALLTKADRVLYGAEPDATYTDSSPDYIRAMGGVFNLHNVELVAPLRSMKGKEEVLKLALNLGVPLDLVHSSRTNRTDGACSASRRLLTTIHKIFPALNPLTLLQLLHDGHLYAEQNPYNLSTPQTNSFKFYPALLLQAVLIGKQKDATIYTTGNWGKSMQFVNELTHLFSKMSVDIVDNEELLKQNKYNTDQLAAIWGTKQALSRLPRPQYLRSSLRCRRTQGHLSSALASLGYTLAPEGIPLITEGDLNGVVSSAK